MGILLGAVLDGAGVVAARMMGIAAAALGLAWWPDRKRLDSRRRREVALSFVGYNLGVGLLFLARRFTIGRASSVSSPVGAIHPRAGIGFAVTTSKGDRSGDGPE